jgi:hypothetical protein
VTEGAARIRQEPLPGAACRMGHAWGSKMQSESNGHTPWQKIWKFLTNPTVEVLLVIAVVLVSAWVVIETETSHRKSPFPILFGHK